MNDNRMRTSKVILVRPTSAYEGQLPPPKEPPTPKPIPPTVSQPATDPTGGRTVKPLGAVGVPDERGDEIRNIGERDRMPDRLSEALRLPDPADVDVVIRETTPLESATAGPTAGPRPEPSPSRQQETGQSDVTVHESATDPISDLLYFFLPIGSLSFSSIFCVLMLILIFVIPQFRGNKYF